ncbi:MAG TPA: hypothetical protein VIN59_09910 [Alphaproteobacteria bacterium]
MNFLRKFLNAETLVNILLVVAAVHFIMQLVPLGLQVANAKEGTSIVAYLLAIISGLVRAAYQPMVLIALAAIINAKTKA